MASPTSQGYNRDSNIDHAYNNNSSNDDDDTDMAGSSRGKFEAVEHEIKVKWQLPGTNDIREAKKHMANLLTSLLMTFPGKTSISWNVKRLFEVLPDNVTR